VNDKICTVEEAMSGIKDGDSVAIHFWGLTGTPGYLLRYLKACGVKDLTLYCNNFLPGMAILEEMGLVNITSLLPQLKRVVSPFIGGRAFRRLGADETEDIFEGRVKRGELELETSTHGVFIERFMAGAMGSGGFYSPIGINTIIEKDKERRIIDGKEYILEKPIRPDIGLIKAHKADKLGNLVYHGTSRGANPIIAMASKLTIVEVFDIVEEGELDPEMIVTPSIYVDRIVKIPEDDVASDGNISVVLKMIIKRRLEAEATAEA
jgi:3-oxoacid CoA-transferase A subunit